MLNHKLRELFYLLGATSAEIARYAGCSPSGISRLVAGTRVPKTTGPTVHKLLNGIYLFARDRNELAILCSFIDVDVSAAPEAIRFALFRWLFDDRDLSDANAIGQIIPFSNFSWKMNAVMELLDLSNIRLARAVNTDPSYISRFRNGVRSPKANVALIMSICNELLLHITMQKKENELAALMEIEPEPRSDPEMLRTLFSKWLCDFSASRETETLDKLLDSLDRFTPVAGAKLPRIHETAKWVSYEHKSTYHGIDGLRTAVVRFLNETVNGSARELYLYSDQDMQWLVGDPAFLKVWSALMFDCVRKRVRITIIHNVNRNSDEMVSAVVNWLPLYLSGMIIPYICHTEGETRFAHTLFLSPNKACINACHFRGCEAEGNYRYITDRTELSSLRREFDGLLAQSDSPVRFYVDREDFLRAMTGRTKTMTGFARLSSCFSAVTMPEDLLERILDRNGIKGEERKHFLKRAAAIRAQYAKISEHHIIHGFISLPGAEELRRGEITLNIEEISDRTLYYTPQEYREHLTSMIKRLRENHNYRVCLLPEMPFEKIQILAEKDFAAVIRKQSPFISVVFNEPSLLRSFADFFDMLAKRAISSRTEVIRTLSQYARTL